jgi:hypothetical protein
LRWRGRSYSATPPIETFSGGYVGKSLKRSVNIG